MTDRTLYITHADTIHGQPYRNWLLVLDAETGQPIDNVVEADPDAGFYVREVTGPDGKPVLEGDSFKTERVDAKIRLELREDAPDGAVEWFSIPSGNRGDLPA